MSGRRRSAVLQSYVQKATLVLVYKEESGRPKVLALIVVCRKYVFTCNAWLCFFSLRYAAARDEKRGAYD